MRDRDVLLSLRERILPLIPESIRPPLRWAFRKTMVSKWVRKQLLDDSSLQKCHDYWSNPPLLNKPSAYMGDDDTSEFLLSFVTKHINRTDRILEIGCNMGRNLNTLYLNGYKNLCGIEICAEALELLRQTYPNLDRDCQLYNAPVEDVIGSIPDQEYGAVFTLAVLEHIHTDSEWIFRDMVRIARDSLIIIEDETAISWRTFTRNYKKVFEKLGMEQVEEARCQSLPGMGGGSVARVLVHRNNIGN